MDELDRRRALEITYTTGWFPLSSEATSFRILATSSILAVGPIRTALTWALKVGDVQCTSVEATQQELIHHLVAESVNPMASGGIRSLLSMQPTCRKEPNMKCKLLIRVSFLVASLVALPTLSWGAEDGAALYKSKCAVCHGASGEGKPAMKAPALRGTPLTADQITEHTMKGTANSKAPHNKGTSGISDAQAEAISEFVKTLLPEAKSR